MFIDDLPTPSLLIDLPRLTKNLEQMQTKANLQSVALRPHIKTHKSVALAQKQLALGAKGITVAKPSEAAVFVRAGFKEVRLAYSVVGQKKHEQLLSLMNEASISFCVDTYEGAKQASDFYASHGKTATVLCEVDVDYGRCGVRWNREESVAFYQYLQFLPGLNVVGILTHAGQSYHGPEHEAENVNQSLKRVAIEERGRMLSFANRLYEAGLVTPENFEISIGSTPSMVYFENQSRSGFRITEIRPGNYVFNDGIQVALTVATLQECSLTVLATVISKHRTNRGSEKLFLDAGKKTLTTDIGYKTVGFGTLIYNPKTMQPLPHTRITGLSEEHGWVHVSGGATLSVGDRVQVVPNHSCVVAGLQQQYYITEGNSVVDTWQVDAHGCLT